MKQIFKFICCGSVDAGKSTLIGRLLLDTGNVKIDQLEDAKKASLKNGASYLEPAMLLDGLLDERAQQITIDVAHRYFDYKDIRFHILDCPGHTQYTKNMAIAAAQAQAAVVVVDVTKGILEQTRNHIRICDLFHIPFLCICLTKCDLLPGKKSFSERPLVKKLTHEIKTFLSNYHFDYTVLPVSAMADSHIQDVLQILFLQAQAVNKKVVEQQERVLHVLATKVYRGKRYYYAREVNSLEVKPGKYWVYPQHLPLTITKIVSPGCFQIKEELDIAAGDCITNTPIYVNNFLLHQPIWFDAPMRNLLFKHGARLARVIHYTDTELELDQPILFHNIEDLKMNGFGIFIDEVSKRTLGCCVFTGNKETPQSRFQAGQIYWLENTTEVFREAVKDILGISVYLETEVLKKTLFSNKKSSYSLVYTLAQFLSKQGLSVGIISAPGKKEIPLSEGKSACPTIRIRIARGRVYVSTTRGRRFSLPLPKQRERVCAQEIKKSLL